MVNQLFAALTTRNKMLPEKNLVMGWDSPKFSFHSLNIVAHHVVPPSIELVLSRIKQVFDPAIIISDKVGRMSTLFTSPFWFLRNIALPITNCWLPWPVTEWEGYQWPPSDFGFHLDCWIRHFSYNANSKYRWQKNIRIRENKWFLR